MLPYTLKGYRSNNDGKFYGFVVYDGATISSLLEGENAGLKSEDALNRWARLEAASHKSAITPADKHVVERSFSL